MSDRRQHETCIIRNPERNLLAAILNEAIRDWKVCAALRKPTKKRDGSVKAFEFAEEIGYKNPREELLEFFHSPWCREICAELSLPYEDLLEKANIPPPA